MKKITLEELLIFHEKITDQTGGSRGVRDEGLLQSALSRGDVTFDGQELYTPDERKIAVIAHSLIANHGFVDGNKRIGVAVMILLCKLNHIELKYTQQELIDLGLAVASDFQDEEDIFNWIIAHKE